MPHCHTEGKARSIHNDFANLRFFLDTSLTLNMTRFSSLRAVLARRGNLKSKFSNGLPRFCERKISQ
ncbi:hypothetical protein [Helicobacter sp. T3_23-1059]